MAKQVKVTVPAEILDQGAQRLNATADALEEQAKVLRGHAASLKRGVIPTVAADGDA